MFGETTSIPFTSQKDPMLICTTAVLDGVTFGIIVLEDLCNLPWLDVLLIKVPFVTNLYVAVGPTEEGSENLKERFIDDEILLKKKVEELLSVKKLALGEDSDK